MPRSVYILCSDGGVVDQHSHLESVFNIFDVVQFTVVESTNAPKNAPLAPGVKMRITAVWERSSDRDAKSEFEHELVVHYPGKRKPHVLVNGKFLFTLSRQRFMYLLPGLQVFEEGFISLESRIRKRGSDKWMSQAYHLEIKVTRQQIDVTKKPSGKADEKRQKSKARSRPK